LGKLAEIRAKMLRTPQNLLAPAPMRPATRLEGKPTNWSRFCDAGLQFM